MQSTRIGRVALAIAASAALVFTGAASCDDGSDDGISPGVPASGEQGDGFDSGGDVGSEDEGGAGDEVGGGGNEGQNDTELPPTAVGEPDGQ